ncbi:MAG: hypothetical protein H6620_07150, partial [Halobacteriovoraceae bacterium]|nr:hypothetical protein [Halobacteriovoraceae bacterium]
MKSLLRTFFIPTLKTRIKWLVIITLGLFTASLFQVRVLIIVLISLSIGFLLLSDFSSFNFAKNTSWLTNSYYNKKTLLKYFYINQFLRSILLSLSCLIVTGIGFLLLINISDTHHLDLVTNKILDGSVTKTHAPIQTSGLGNFRTLLSLGFLYFIGPIVMYFCPNALHQTPQDIYRKKFKNAFGDHNYKNYLLNLIWIIPLVFIQVFQLWSK